MESSQVSWQKDVAYDDLIKKCPYLAQKSGVQLEPEVNISKSKRKRLKKRYKALCVANKSASVDENKASINQSETASNILIETTHFCQDLSTNIQGKQKDKKIDKSKAQVESDKSKGKVLVKSQSVFNEGKMSSNSKSTAPVKERVPDTVDGEVLMTNSNRGQVLADREARKKTKQLVKQQKKGDGAAERVEAKSFVSSSNKISNDDISTNFHLLSLENNKKTGAKSLTKCDNSIVKTDDETLSNQVEIKSLATSNVISNVEKSRADVLAEREAKKKAKQLNKVKKGDKSTEIQSSDQNLVNCNINANVEAQSKINESFNEGSGVPSTTTIVAVEKSKAELKAERRAKQEAQRAAKEADKKTKSDEKSSNKENKTIVDDKRSPQNDILKERKVADKSKKISQQRIKLFSHLHVGSKPTGAQIIQNIHPSVIKLGMKYSSRIINGSNARCVALLNCLKDVIQDYVTPAEKEFSRGLETKLGELTNYLNQCRPMAVSMTNALRHLKSHLTQLPNNVSDDEAKRKLLDVIDIFIREQIDVAGEAICESVKKKIANNDVILIYSCSSLLCRILTESRRGGREFSVVVVDGGPWFEGREMLRRLLEAGLNCTYVQLSAVSFIMKQATKVLLGAHALLANGCVMSRAGSSLIALAAHSCNVPVLVCCETYKFCERVQTDAYVYNELGGAEEVLAEEFPNLSPLSLLYDITPPDLVTAVVTELAILPCTSVPVILRIKPSDHVS